MRCDSIPAFNLGQFSTPFYRYVAHLLSFIVITSDKVKKYLKQLIIGIFNETESVHGEDFELWKLLNFKDMVFFKLLTLVIVSNTMLTDQVEARLSHQLLIISCSLQ